MSNESNEFVFPEDIDVGDPVEYSADGTSKDRCTAMVMEVKRGSAKSVDVMLLPSMEFRRDCWHINDPRVEAKKQVFIEQENRGVFRLVGNHKHRQATSARLASLERVCHDLVIDNGKLKAEMLKLQNPSVSEPTTSVAPSRPLRQRKPLRKAGV